MTFFAQTKKPQELELLEKFVQYVGMLFVSNKGAIARGIFLDGVICAQNDGQHQVEHENDHKNHIGNEQIEGLPVVFTNLQKIDLAPDELEQGRERFGERGEFFERVAEQKMQLKRIADHQAYAYHKKADQVRVAARKRYDHM